MKTNIRLKSISKLSESVIDLKLFFHSQDKINSAKAKKGKDHLSSCLFADLQLLLRVYSSHNHDVKYVLVEATEGVHIIFQ